ncbi:23S rRNA (uracil(1939)-C(5))-methyltransferase RlmD [Saccharibacillus brassicae]|uniref:23S rRNA (uracil(1939)-C(5))-methyltransferase RlmD n=3 Tax=Saccharibacillus TaxID=456492 RepID=UPI00123A05F2
MSEHKDKSTTPSRKERKLLTAKEEKKKNRGSGKKPAAPKRSAKPAAGASDSASAGSRPAQAPGDRPAASGAQRRLSAAAGGARGARGSSAGGSRPAGPRSAKPADAGERLTPAERYEKRQSERVAGAPVTGSTSGKPYAGDKGRGPTSGQPYAGGKVKAARTAAARSQVQASADTGAQGLPKPARPHSAAAAPGKKPYAGAGGAAARPAASPADAEQVKLGDVIVVTIKRIGINGEGVGYFRRKAVFIDGAITNEVVKAEVLETHEKFLKAKLVEVEKRSPDRVEPPCPVFGICGGCQIQHISYEGQLRAKLEIVREAFSRYANLSDLKIKPTLGMDQPWDYRNKAQLQVERRDVKGSKSEIVAGLYEIGSHEIVDISGCPIQHPQVNRAIDRVKSVLGELNIPLSKGDSRGGRSDIKDSGTRKGVRTIVVRSGFQSGEIQVTLVTETADLPRHEELIERLRLELPEMSGLSINVNPLKTPLIFGERTISLWGSEAMSDSLGDLNFTLSPRAFFQLNPEQTIKLYETVRAAAALTGKETVVDAYCGTGTIGLWLAPYAAEVRGIEIIPEAVADATRNAEQNGRDNATFFEGEAEELLPRWAKDGLRPDVIVADPPRTGLDRKFLETILRAKPKKFVYVSCNPSTLAKDCKVLLDGGYEIQSVQPVDMFPQTSQVEAVTVLVQKETAK